MDSNGDNEMRRPANEAAMEIDRPSDGGPFVGMTLLFVVLIAMGLA
jgi:hypothetical protein